MTKLENKSNLMYKCNVCDKPYIKKGALTNHLKKVHNLSMSPTKKEFMDISCNSELENDLEKENSVLIDYAKELDKKDEADELEIMLGMKSTVTFDASILTAASATQEPAKVTTILPNDICINAEPLSNVPLCAPAAKFLSESQKRIIIPDIQESEDDKAEVKETTPTTYICNHCKKTFTTEQELKKHKKIIHSKGYNSAGDQQCEECSYRTNFAAHYLHHILDTHADKELARTIKSLKPVDSAVIYMLAEQNMALTEESKKMKKDLDYIKKALKPKSRAAKFTCQKCKDLCGAPTRIQEHMLEDHCCKYCDQVFASKTEKERHKKYMCSKCKLTFGHTVELNIHNRTYHKEPPQVLQFHCTECSQEEKTEEDIIKHIETKHTDILRPALVKQPTRTHKTAEDPSPPKKQFHCPICSFQNPAEAEITKHIESKHTEKCKICQIEFTCKSDMENHVVSAHKKVNPPEKYICKKCSHEFENNNELSEHMTKVHDNNNPPTLFECDKCNKKFTNKNELKSHTDKTHVSRMKFKNTLLVADSHSKYQNPRLIEREALGGQGLFAPSFMHPRLGRAYCSSPDWPNSYYPENNLKDKIPELLRSREHSLLIFGAPGNDISNIGSIESQSERYRLAVKSSENCILIAEEALRVFPMLEKVVIHERLPRADSLADLSEYSNFALSSLVEKSPMKNRISVVPMTALQFTTDEEMEEIFGSPTSQSFDGIHLNGQSGYQLYNQCLISAIKTAGISAQKEPRRRRNVQEGQAGRQAGGAVGRSRQEEPTFTTYNRFEVLN